MVFLLWRKFPRCQWGFSVSDFERKRARIEPEIFTNYHGVFFHREAVGFQSVFDVVYHDGVVALDRDGVLPVENDGEMNAPGDIGHATGHARQPHKGAGLKSLELNPELFAPLRRRHHKSEFLVHGVYYAKNCALVKREN